MAMMYYIPPLSPVVSVIEEELFKLDVSPEQHDFELFDRLDAARLPVQYLANLFAAGNEAPVRAALRKLLAVRTYMRRKTVDGAVDEQTLALLAEAGTNRGRGRGDLPADHPADPGRALRDPAVPPRDGRRGLDRSAGAQGRGRLRLRPGARREVSEMEADAARCLR